MSIEKLRALAVKLGSAPCETADEANAVIVLFGEIDELYMQLLSEEQLDHLTDVGVGGNFPAIRDQILKDLETISAP